MSVVGFGAEVARLQSWVIASEIDTFVAVFVGVILLPVWLAWVGVVLMGMEGQEFSHLPVEAPRDYQRSGHQQDPPQGAYRDPPESELAQI